MQVRRRVGTRHLTLPLEPLPGHTPTTTTGGPRTMTDRSTTRQALPLGDVLSVTTGKLVSRDHMGGVYNVLNYMTGESLMTHQLPRAADECRPKILAQHPWLADVPPLGTLKGEVHVFEWLAEQEKTYGHTVELEPLAPEDHTVIDLITELGLMGVPPEKIIPAVVVPEQEA